MHIKKYIYYLKRPFHFVKTGLLQALPAEVLTKFPQKKLTIIAITGTDGKTTTAGLVFHILKSAHIKAGLVSTVAAYAGNDEQDTGFHVTSPQPKDLYQFMRKLVDEGYTHLVLEITSHGAYQFRNWGIKPKFAGLTNISREHLDYHVTYREYVKAKLGILDSAEQAFINLDDYSYSEIKKLSKAGSYQSYSAQNPLPAKVQTAIQHRFPQPYNQMNARLAFRITQALEIEENIISKAIANFPDIPGRMELVASKPCRVIVDFAHTPQAVGAVLAQLKTQFKKGKLIAVLGSAGRRDVAKRPEMGKIAVALADYVVFTAEDPRTEDVWSIIRQMKEGLTENHHKVVTLVDRLEAIEFAINKLSRSTHDTVVILGKGHEKSMCYGHEEKPWSDQQAVQQVIAS